MNAVDIYQAALAAGFNPSQAVTMTAIALAESSGNPTAHNPNRATGDDSYGLWQINMIDTLGPARRTQFGIDNNDALYDPHTNAAAAFKVSGGGANFTPWTTFTSGAYKSHLAEAQAAAGGQVMPAADTRSLGDIAAPPPAPQSLGSKLGGLAGIVGGQPNPGLTQVSTAGDSLGDRLKAIHDIISGGGPAGV